MPNLGMGELLIVLVIVSIPLALILGLAVIVTKSLRGRRETARRVEQLERRLERIERGER